MGNIVGLAGCVARVELRFLKEKKMKISILDSLFCIIFYFIFLCLMSCVLFLLIVISY